MADAIVSIVLEQLTSFAVQEIKGGVSLVTGAGKAVESLPSTLGTVQAVLRDAEEKQVKDKAVKLWLDKLKDAAYDMEDVFSQLDFRRRISLEIKDINERLDAIAKEKDRYSFTIRSTEQPIRSTEQPQRDPTTSFVDVSEIYGRNEENATLVSKLLGESTSREGRSLHIISIVGMGGMGKATLAQLAYNNNEVVNKFEKRMWVCVSDPFDEFKVAKEIIEALTRRPFNLGALQSVLESISESIEGKKFLLVLDDVWTEDYDKWVPLYNCLKNGHYESKILITTRNKTVAQVMKSIDIITINELHEESCWSLFKSLAFSKKSPDECEELEGIGRKIVGKCKGLPLAAKIMGSLLRFKKGKEEWESVLHSEMWKLEKFEEDLFSTLFLSYNDLPSMVKRCFSYCAIFKKDYDINKDELIKLWMAQGYLDLEQNKEMELIGEEYFDILVARSLFQDLKKNYDDNSIIGCKMHDIVHDFTLFLTKNEKGHHAMLAGEEVSLANLVSICNVKNVT
ncbi:putative disease resistance protein RGA3 [Pistacia vera]|uniref:putative disease resistance protein RGA3 n=1 Tax=Pistacia vera TaxID=55513 RepID=UPI001262F46C|nr:putative disease resistance protein RGA3 [Pistacia vera]